MIVARKIFKKSGNISAKILKYKDEDAVRVPASKQPGKNGGELFKCARSNNYEGQAGIHSD